MVYGKKMDKRIDSNNGSDKALVPIFSRYNDDSKDTVMFKATLMVFAIFATLSLLITGCSSQQPAAPSPIPQVPTSAGNLENTGTTPTPTVEKNVSLDYGNKSEVQKTQDQIAQFIADGAYDDQVTYAYHSGVTTVDIKVTTRNDVVIEASVTGINADRTSEKYITAFNGALPNLVIGKKINEIQIPHTVSGSSLTSAAFAQHLQDLTSTHPATG